MARGRKKDTPDTGKMGYRDDDPFTPEDDRPVIKRARYYESEVEQEFYEGLARRAFGKVPLGSFLEAVRIKVSGEGKPKSTGKILRPFPQTKLSQEEQDRRLQDLREQGRDYWND